MFSVHHWFNFKSLLWASILSLTFYAPGASWAAEGFQPVSPEELKMTSEPLAPGAPAIVLYREVNRNDKAVGSIYEYNYVRIKILTEEGRKQADVEIQFLREQTSIDHIGARAVRPDGSVVNFSGKIVEKALVKARQVGLMAKTFAIPGVEVGGIIEYFYTVNLKSPNYIYDSHWILSNELFTKMARFSLTPYGSFNLRWSWQKLPPGAEAKEGPDHVVRMEAHNIPAFQTEDFMPPENELKARVDFIYSFNAFEKDPAKFWQEVGKNRTRELEKFIGKRQAMEQAVAEIVSPADSPEVKLRKIYDRVQQIRNTSYEVEKTEQEQKRANQKADENVEDVWKRGYGDGIQITWLFLALARASGFEAYGCWVSNRGEYFFNPNTMEGQKLNTNVTLIKLNGKDLYFDPGAAFTPFGMLEWAESGVAGLRLDKNGGTFIQTALPASSESRVERKAKLQISEEGSLHGKLTVTYTGLEGMSRRVSFRHADEAARKKFLEGEAESEIPAGSTAELSNKPDWSSSTAPLVAEFDLSIPGWAQSAGSRRMVGVGVFSEGEKHLFEHAGRVQPIYFEYPYEKADDITIELSDRWRAATLPPPHVKDVRAVSYELKTDGDKDALHVTRKLVVNVMLLEQKYYPALRDFFQIVRTGDEEQIVLQPNAARAGK